jgi:hypothetical protein
VRAAAVTGSASLAPLRRAAPKAGTARIARLRPPALLLAMAMAAALAVPARGGPAPEQPIVLRPNPSDADWRILLEQLGLEDGVATRALAGEAHAVPVWIEDLIERKLADDEAAALAEIRRSYVATARLDLTGDGIEELVVVIGFDSLTCGARGCDAFILQGQAESWVAVARPAGMVPGATLCLEPRSLPFGSKRYPVLRSRTDAIWWTGKEFHDVCYEDCQGLSDYKLLSQSFRFSLTDEERFLPERLREQPWCAPD